MPTSNPTNFKLGLEQLKKAGLLKKASEIGQKPVEAPQPLLKIFPEGTYVETPFKNIFKTRYVCSTHDLIGDIRISRYLETEKEWPMLLTVLGRNENLAGFKKEQILFFDVESTGLTSGAGNMVFLIGLGYFEADDFIIEQYFIEDFFLEKALLHVLKDIFSYKKHLISFNGKSFDFHVLKNRFILSRRFEFTLDNLLHFDLLHASRRMWKNILTEFNLEKLEKKILNFFRTEEDIPGYLVPEYYKRYLKTKNAGVIKPVFYHNFMDIRSMLGLFIIQMSNMSLLQKGEIPETINHSLIADLFRRKDKALYLKLLYQGSKGNKAEKIHTCYKLYKYYKQEKDFSEARKILEMLLAENEKFDYYLYKELSLLLEHQEKDAVSALRILEDCRTRMEHRKKLFQDAPDKEWDDLFKRLARLEKKCLKK